MILDDILLTSLKRINNPDGDVLHAMKQSDAGFAGFGEAYFSWVANGSIKAWKRHKKMTMNLIVPVGNVQFEFRMNEGDAVREEKLGVDHYARITVPPGIWFGFQGMASPESLVLNIANISHMTTEVEHRTQSEFFMFGNHL